LLQPIWSAADALRRNGTSTMVGVTTIQSTCN
jgi:hypothetical protein